MIIERIEEDIVIIELEDGKHIEVSKNNFPENIKEGDFVFKSEDNYFVDVDKTANLREKITELQSSLWN
ncbi:MAG: DUF3006 domain-containing protein [Oscillospiraceae bacterium]|nr:DUF3006 domain-containing protein [Oscillospiraceae bacterium]